MSKRDNKRQKKMKEMKIMKKKSKNIIKNTIAKHTKNTF